MLSVIKSKRFLTSLLISIFSFCAAILYNLSALLQFDLELLGEMWTELSSRIFPIVISSGLFTFIIAFICSYLGSLFFEKMKLNQNKIDKNGIILISITGIIVPLLIGVLDFFVYYEGKAEFISLYYSLINVTTSVLYNGIVEEILFRHCLLLLMVYTFYYIFEVKKNKIKKVEQVEGIDKKYYIAGIVFVSLLLFIIQFNVVLTSYYFTFSILLRAILVYLVPNILYSVLYLKYNIKTSMIAHSLFMVMFLGIIPFIFSLF